MFKKTFTFAVAFMALTSIANAAITNIHWESLDGDSAVTSSVQNTLFTSMTADWTNAVIEIDLTSGSLLNPLASPPPFNENRNYGANENDTWTDAPNSLYGYPTNVEFDIANGYFDYFDTADNGSVIDGIAARIYASDDAQGSWLVKMYDSESAGTPTTLTGTVVNGAFASMDVPEPSTIAMLLIGLGTIAGFVTRRK